MTTTPPPGDRLDVLVVNLHRIGTGEVALGTTLDGAELVPIIVLGADTVVVEDGIPIGDGMKPHAATVRTIGVTMPVLVELVSSLVAGGMQAAMAAAHAHEDDDTTRSAYL